jgi:gamma-glutamyltranspeptidase/glutathione hydrolase
MKKFPRNIQLILLLSLCATWLPQTLFGLQDNRQVARGEHGMVATVHPLATQAGIDAMNAGGNAVDGAIAAALMLGVVDGYNSGIGGGCFVLVRTAAGDVFALDAREMAPAAAHRDMYIRDGKPDTSLSQIGPLASGVPGALAGYAAALERFGKRSLRDAILPAARVAEDGFEMSDSYAELVRQNAEYFRNYEGSRAVFLGEDGQPYPAGHRLVQRDLAQTYRMIAQHGTAWFYTGEFAERTGQWMVENGGIMTAADFSNYKVVQRQPIHTTYRGFDIYGFPPPSSGGVHVAQMLNILENFDLKQLHDESNVRFTHVVGESMKFAFADRAYWLGDPDHADVPRGLLDQDYARQLADRIDPGQAVEVTSHGTPPAADSDFFEKHTTHIAAADDEGNWVAITTTVNTTFGSKVIVPGLGVVMNNQMDDFAIAPGVPNAFGLVGNDANSVAPGKRPLSSMSPTIVVRDGRPVMTVGAAGGPRIITNALLAVIRCIDLQMPIDAALREPRFHHQWSPDRLYLEKGFAAEDADALKAMGHRVFSTTTSGISQGIWFDEASHTFLGVADPRAGGMAMGR